jgi:uncharacterized membrane protein YfcA
MEMTYQLVIIVAAIEFVCFFIKGLAAFGDPLISNPILSFYMENRVISPMNLLLQTPLNGWIAWKNRKKISLGKPIFMLFFIMCGIIPGVLLLKYATSWILKAVLGLLVLGIGLEMIIRNRIKPVGENKVVMAVVSFCSGVSSGLYGINLFFVAYIERTSKDRADFRGNVCFIFFVDCVVRIILYAVMGIFTRHILLLALVSIPGMVTGFILGSRVDTKLSEMAIRRIITALFMFGGLSIFVKSIIWKM